MESDCRSERMPFERKRRHHSRSSRRAGKVSIAFVPPCVSTNLRADGLLEFLSSLVLGVIASLSPFHIHSWKSCDLHRAYRPNGIDRDGGELSGWRISGIPSFVARCGGPRMTTKALFPQPV